MHLLTEGKLCSLKKMDKVVAMKSSIKVKLDDSGKAEEGSGLKYADLSQTSLPDGQNTDMHRCQGTIEDGSALKYHKYSPPLSGVKVRYKRQVLQNMARPLKHWLYKHRDNPYPTKTEKVLLALGSHMTLVQVSNWFANARRRLKNTVRHPDLSWALRIKLYNKYVQGNAERLSTCSDDTDPNDEECTQQALISQLNLGRSFSHQAIPDCPNNTSPPSKYKSSLLNRYLNDTLGHVMTANSNGAASTRNRRSCSESFSFNKCDQDVCPPSSFETETNLIYYRDTTEYTSNKSDTGQQQDKSLQRRDDQDWREIHAAVALTSLAQSIAPLSGTAMGQSCTRDVLSLPRSTNTRPALASKHTTDTTLASRIFQKSSCISEVQTVQAALANSR